MTELTCRECGFRGNCLGWYQDLCPGCLESPTCVIKLDRAKLRKCYDDNRGAKYLCYDSPMVEEAIRLEELAWGLMLLLN